MTRRLFLAIATLPCLAMRRHPHVGLHPAYRAYLYQSGVSSGEILMIERYGGEPKFLTRPRGRR